MAPLRLARLLLAALGWLAIAHPPEASSAASLEREPFQQARRSAQQVNPNKRSNRDGRTALMYLAVNSGLSPEEKSSVARLILQRESDLSLMDDQGNTALHHAVMSGGEPLARLLLERGADGDTPNLEGSSPFQLAMKSSRPGLIALFLDHGRYVDNRNIAGRTALYDAAEAGDLDLVKQLLARGADPTFSNRTALMGAVIGGRTNVVRYLLELARVPADAATSDGETPLMGAAAGGRIDLVRYLVEEWKADVNAVSAAGGTPLRFAAEAGQVEILRYLIGRGAELERSTPTAISAAARKRQRSAVEFLLTQQPGLGSGSEANPGPLYWAVLGGGFDIAQMLIAQGASFPTLPADPPPLLLVALHREFAYGRLERDDRQNGVMHLRAAANACRTAVAEIQRRSRELHNKANRAVIARISLNALAIMAGSAASHMQSRTYSEMAALRHAKDSGTGLPGYYTALRSLEQVPAANPIVVSIPAAGSPAGSAARSEARILDSQAEQCSRDRDQFLAIADCIAALAPADSPGPCRGLKGGR